MIVTPILNAQNLNLPKWSKVPCGKFPILRIHIFYLKNINSEFIVLLKQIVQHISHNI